MTNNNMRNRNRDHPLGLEPPGIEIPDIKIKCARRWNYRRTFGSLCLKRFLIVTAMVSLLSTFVMYVVHYQLLGGVNKGHSTQKIQQSQHHWKVSIHNTNTVLEGSVARDERLSGQKSSFPPGCSWDCYVNRYPDLQKQNFTEKEALDHFNKRGRIREGRTCHCVYFHCCDIQCEKNAGHALTENVADLYQCRPVLAFRGSCNSKNHPHFLQVANILNYTHVVTPYECNEYYHSNPPSLSIQNNETKRLVAYSRMSHRDNHRYDGIEVARILRDYQAKIMRSCGLSPPKYTANFGGEVVESQYKQLVSRPASSSVVIVVRHPMRKLLNYKQILSLCQDMKLQCSVFSAGHFFHQPESDNLCHVLRQFQGKLVIGVQGAEIFYPLFLGERLFLMVHNIDLARPMDFRRIGNTTKSDEVAVALNLIRKGNAQQQFDPYFPEFSAMFGADLTPILSSIDSESLEIARNSTKTQCHQGKHNLLSTNGLHRDHM